MKKIIPLILVVCFCSCRQKLKYGNVIEKNYHPEWTQLMLLPMVISTGKSTTTMMIPYWIHHNDNWSIDVKGIGAKGDTITRTYYIDKLDFDTTNIGKFICVEKLCDDDTSIHKTRK